MNLVVTHINTLLEHESAFVFVNVLPSVDRVAYEGMNDFEYMNKIIDYHTVHEIRQVMYTRDSSFTFYRLVMNLVLSSLHYQLTTMPKITY